MAQLEQKAAEEAGLEGNYESSEPTSMTNSSTVEGEHTIQNPESEPEELASEEEGRKLLDSKEREDVIGHAVDTSLSSNNVDSSHSSIHEVSDQDSNDGRKNKMGDLSKQLNSLPLSADSSNATTPATTPGGEDINKDFTSATMIDDIQLLKLRLEEVSNCRIIFMDKNQNVNYRWLFMKYDLTLMSNFQFL